MLFAAILSGSTGSSSALSTKWRRSFSFVPSIITKGQLCITIDSILLRSSRLCELCKPRAIKKKLKSPGYVFSPYELKKVAKEDDKFPRDAIIVRGFERFFVKNQVDDIIIGYALSYHIYLQCKNLFSDRFFFSLFREKDFIREVGSWGPAHSIYVFDVHTIIHEVDLKDIRCFLHPLLMADRSILRILESLVDRKCLKDQTRISPRGLSFMPFLSLLVSSLVKKVDYLFSSLVKDKCPTPFCYARFDYTIFVCIPEGKAKDPTALEYLFENSILWNVRLISSGISMEVCRPGEGPVHFRNGIISLDHEKNPHLSIKNKMRFFYKKHPPPWNSEAWDGFFIPGPDVGT